MSNKYRKNLGGGQDDEKKMTRPKPRTKSSSSSSSLPSLPSLSLSASASASASAAGSSSAVAAAGSSSIVDPAQKMILSSAEVKSKIPRKNWSDFEDRLLLKVILNTFIKIKELRPLKKFWVFIANTLETYNNNEEPPRNHRQCRERFYVLYNKARIFVEAYNTNISNSNNIASLAAAMEKAEKSHLQELEMLYLKILQVLSLEDGYKLSLNESFINNEESVQHLYEDVRISPSSKSGDSTITLEASPSAARATDVGNVQVMEVMKEIKFQNQITSNSENELEVERNSSNSNSNSNSNLNSISGGESNNSDDREQISQNKRRKSEIGGDLSGSELSPTMSSAPMAFLASGETSSSAGGGVGNNAVNFSPDETQVIRKPSRKFSKRRASDPMAFENILAEPLSPQRTEPHQQLQQQQQAQQQAQQQQQSASSGAGVGVGFPGNVSFGNFPRTGFGRTSIGDSSIVSGEIGNTPANAADLMNNLDSAVENQVSKINEKTEEFKNKIKLKIENLLETTRESSSLKETCQSLFSDVDDFTQILKSDVSKIGTTVKEGLYEEPVREMMKFWTESASFSSEEQEQQLLRRRGGSLGSHLNNNLMALAYLSDRVFGAPTSFGSATSSGLQSFSSSWSQSFLPQGENRSSSIRSPNGSITEKQNPRSGSNDESKRNR
ncbi:hypothetical protein PACTADRAFT_49811 [Pachysolen tannophilus NRRL Y-2460]|uniref:Myb-like domain-containing protein n=1 Tax=Pachysolen tannophilus NRRL Y-2460 TaxID=669874 RepID=A0A1E4TXM6_PACTA|nr:hypothetical protein PACTADRAFT_49811 [Pachysolen tannophilus NRRL Y-2460]